jgi:F-type H+-transporting ATPase subunit b
MRRFFAFLLLLIFVVPVVAMAAESQDPNNVAHGAEKAAHKEAHPTEAHGEHGEAPKTYFGIPGWILKLANLILFWGVLLYLIGGPVKKALASRRDSIQAAAVEAAARRQKADQIATEIQARLSQIEGEVRGIHERAQVEGERQKRELIAAAEAEAEKIVKTARNEVENRLKHARHELTELAGQLATERAESLLRERITEQDQHKLFEESLQQVGEGRS